MFIIKKTMATLILFENNIKKNKHFKIKKNQMKQNFLKRNKVFAKISNS